MNLLAPVVQFWSVDCNIELLECFLVWFPLYFWHAITLIIFGTFFALALILIICYSQLSLAIEGNSQELSSLLLGDNLVFHSNFRRFLFFLSSFSKTMDPLSVGREVQFPFYNSHFKLAFCYKNSSCVVCC